MHRTVQHTEVGDGNVSQLPLGTLQILPDITEDRWSYNGTAAVEGGRHKGQSAHTWVWKLKNKSDYGEYDNTYTFYADKVGFGRDCHPAYWYTGTEEPCQEYVYEKGCCCHVMARLPLQPYLSPYIATCSEIIQPLTLSQIEGIHVC